ncbi:MAG: hypothetical protein HY335_10625 [Deinococcus sp.]|nr:hypothetical protein [Deinococcus sp.]
MSKLVAIAPRRLVFEDAGRFVVYQRSHFEKSSEVKKAWERTFFEELTADLVPVPVATGPRLYYLVGRSPFFDSQLSHLAEHLMYLPDAGAYLELEDFATVNLGKYLEQRDLAAGRVRVQWARGVWDDLVARRARQLAEGDDGIIGTTHSLEEAIAGTEVQWRADQHSIDQVPAALRHLVAEVRTSPPHKRNGATRAKRRGQRP